jgi:AbrB family looped-hinge helix DNA binding protein
MSRATITAKGQTTIPKDVRYKLHLEPGDRVEFMVQDDGTALMVPAKLTLSDLKGCLPPPAKALTLEELDEAVGRAVTAQVRRHPG